MFRHKRFAKSLAQLLERVYINPADLFRRQTIHLTKMAQILLLIQAALTLLVMVQGNPNATPSQDKKLAVNFADSAVQLARAVDELIYDAFPEAKAD